MNPQFLVYWVFSFRFAIFGCLNKGPVKTSRGLERENTGGNCEEGGWDAYVIDLASFKRGPEGFLDTCSQRHVASVDTASD